mmetsp:Transcript_15745/g.37400  ORF Transcript_15745/g.37400 Transcript_15745/m.37400 type:complete len:243 (-) Transcript_15745:152-880(-)
MVAKLGNALRKGDALVPCNPMDQGLKLNCTDGLAAASSHTADGRDLPAREHLLHVVHNLRIRKERVFVEFGSLEPSKDSRQAQFCVTFSIVQVANPPLFQQTLATKRSSDRLWWSCPLCYDNAATVLALILQAGFTGRPSRPRLCGKCVVTDNLLPPLQLRSHGPTFTYRLLARFGRFRVSRCFTGFAWHFVVPVGVFCVFCAASRPKHCGIATKPLSSHARCSQHRALGDFERTSDNTEGG